MILAGNQQQQVASRTVRALDWFQFEKLIALLFEHEGFTAQRFGGARPDGGIDLSATKDGVTFGVQCNHWQTWRVNVKEVRAFCGALQERKLHHGFLVTLKGYTTEASNFAGQNGIELLDEPSLLENLAAVNWLESPAFLELLNDRRKICPKCESEMVLRIAEKGVHMGQKFWGCSAYPICEYKAF